MKRCIVVGKPNVGKTLLVLSLAEYLKVKTIEITFQDPDGTKYSKTYAIGIALGELVGPKPHQTRCLQSMVLQLPAGKGKKVVGFIDTTGLTEYTHQDASIRKAMAQTLAAIRPAQLVIHVVDASEVGRKDASLAARDLDRQLAAFAGSRGGYCIVANKMDLPDAKRGLARLQRMFAGYTIFPVSAVAKTGFREVKRHVVRNL